MTAKYINEITYGNFNKNRAIIRDYYEGVYYCYLINTQGELLHEFEPDMWVNDIECDNVMFVQKTILDAEALFDLNGNQLSDFKYKAIYGGVEEGFFEVVNLDGKHGHISLSGEEIIPCIYDKGHYFKEGIAAEMLNNKWGMINWRNETVIPFEYEEILGCMDNRIDAKLNGKWGIIDKFNNKLVDFKFDELWLYITRDSGSLPARLGDKWGIIDIYGKTLYDFVYDDCDSLDEEGWYKFKKDDKWAIYSCERNEFISDFIYEDIDLYSESICGVKLNGKWDFVDKFNTPISDFQYDCVRLFYGTNLIAIYKNGKCGLMSTVGKILIPPKYDDRIRHASENMLVMEDNKFNEYIMDIEENIVIPKKEYQSFHYGYSCGYIVSVYGLFGEGYYDKKGKKLELKFNLKK